jgi:hypothetical protein
MGHVPLWDRLGFRRTREGTEHALATGTAIPANESILVLNWMRCDLGGTSTDHYIGVGPNETVGGHRVSMLRDDDTIELGVNDGGWQLVVVPIPDSGDHLWGILVDRDNTLLDIYLDGVLVSSAALTNDPTLTANNQVQFNNSTGGANSRISWTSWRGLIQTFANGSTPTQAQMSEALKAMRPPDAPVHTTISGAVGSVYNDWNLGEGLYGSATITDNGTSSDDLAIQGGVTIEDVRTRAQTPVRNPRYDWYEIMPAYSAQVPATDFGFTADPVVGRFCMRAISSDIAGAAAWISINQAAGESITLDYGFGSIMLVPSDSMAAGNPLFTWSQYDTGPMDIFYVQESTAPGSATHVYCNGQLLDSSTITNLLSMAGQFSVWWEGRNARLTRFALWNPATVPATLAQEIRDCAMNPEIDPPSLTNKRVDFPLNSDTLPLVTSTTVANQGLGGGVLTMSAQLSTACATMFTGMNP